MTSANQAAAAAAPRGAAFWLWRAVRTVIIWLAGAVALGVTAWLLPRVTVTNFRAALAMVVLMALLNALLWPLLTRLALPVLAATFGLAAIVLNFLIIFFAARILPGVTITGILSPLWLALAVTAATVLVSAILSVDDDMVFERNLMRRHGRRTRAGDLPKYPGVAFIEIDGLSGAIFWRAVQNGYMPNIRRYLAGSHALKVWETDLSSQTGAAQTGILLGSNDNIPAFQWVDKARGSVYVASSNGQDCQRLESELGTGHGLLAHRGHSIGNLVSGEAELATITYSRLSGTQVKAAQSAWYGFLSSPYAMFRGLVMLIWDGLAEYYGRAKARQNGEVIVAKRLHVYPWERAATIGILSDVITYTVIQDFFTGEVDALYGTLSGYDVVAHAAGVESADAMIALGRVDRNIGRLLHAAREADRPYEIVLLSDHGQSKGLNFEVRYGQPIEGLIQSLLPSSIKVYGGLDSDEGWDHVAVALTEARQEQASLLGRLLGRATKDRVEDGMVQIGPERAGAGSMKQWWATDDTKQNAVVIGSGNLGLVYFPDYTARLTKREIDELAPRLIPGLLAHPGIGWVMAKTDEGSVVLSQRGTYHLDSDRVEGENPLAAYSPTTPGHLRRADGFTNAPDLYFGSFYDPVKDEGTAFEGQMGYHGGIGGEQQRPFVFYPTHWSQPEGDLIGCAALHDQLAAWLAALRGDRAAPKLGDKTNTAAA
jgi:putative membrane protein